MSITTSGTRISSNQRVPFDVILASGSTSENDTNDEISLSVLALVDVDAFSTGTVCTITASSSTVTGPTNVFQKVKVGDRVTTLAGGGTVTLPTPGTFTISVATFNGEKFLKYTGTPTLPKAGDGIAGTGIAVGSKVTKVDTVNKYIYLDLANTESTVAATPITATVSPLLRVATKANDQSITLNTAFGGTGTSVVANLTFNPEPFYATFYTVVFDHTRSADVLSIKPTGYIFDGTLAFDSAGIGSDGLAITSGAAKTLGSTSINTDTFFGNARVARTAI